MKGALSLAVMVMAATMLLTGCEDSIHAGWLVDRTRVLVARVEATAEPARASLSPGESARVTWIIAAPGGTPKLGWTYAACVPPEGNFAEPHCVMPIVASGSGMATTEVVGMDLEVPPAASLGDATALLMLVAFCGDEVPALDARTFTATCTSGDPLLASVVVRLSAAGTNANPPPPSVRLGEAFLSPDEGAADGAPCEAAPDAPRFVAGGASVDLVYVFDGAERESNESIMLSTMVTGGALDRQYSAFDPEESPPKEVRLPWTPPGKGATVAAGRVVRFYVVLRDGRGGASFGRFAVCVGPG